jgi:hypothetical protein
MTATMKIKKSELKNRYGETVPLRQAGLDEITVD